MKLAITGSRRVVNKQLVWFLLKHIITSYGLKPTSLKSGGANGVDKLAEEFFKETYSIIPEVLKPNYLAYPDNMKWKAPLDRNGDIVRDVDYVIAIWEGITPNGKGGTWDAVHKARALEIPVIFVNLELGEIKFYEN